MGGPRCRPASRSIGALASAGLALLLVGSAGVAPTSRRAEAVLAELPFLDSPEPNRIIVDLAPKGSATPLRLMLDTGSSESVMTPLAARELGVSVRRQKLDSSYRRPTLLGRDLLFEVETLGVRHRLEDGLGVRLRRRKLSRRVRRRARLSRAAGPAHRSEAVRGAGGDRHAEEAVLPIRRSSRIGPGVEVTVDGAKFLLLLGTGAPWTAVLLRPARETRRPRKRADRGPRRLGSVIGPIEVELADAKRLTHRALRVRRTCCSWSRRRAGTTWWARTIR